MYINIFSYVILVNMLEIFNLLISFAHYFTLSSISLLIYSLYVPMSIFCRTHVQASIDYVYYFYVLEWYKISHAIVLFFSIISWFQNRFSPTVRYFLFNYHEMKGAGTLTESAKTSVRLHCFQMDGLQIPLLID